MSSFSENFAIQLIVTSVVWLTLTTSGCKAQRSAAFSCSSFRKCAGGNRVEICRVWFRGNPCKIDKRSPSLVTCQEFVLCVSDGKPLNQCLRKYNGLNPCTNVRQKTPHPGLGRSVPSAPPTSRPKRMSTFCHIPYWPDANCGKVQKLWIYDPQNGECRKTYVTTCILRPNVFKSEADCIDDCGAKVRWSGVTGWCSRSSVNLCTGNAFYNLIQCDTRSQNGRCWCLDPIYGTTIQGTEFNLRTTSRSVVHCPDCMVYLSDLLKLGEINEAYRQHKAGCKAPALDNVSCQLSPWSDWSACSVTCGGTGRRNRSRTVLTSPSGRGAPCPSLTDLQKCDTPACPVSVCPTGWSPSRDGRGAPYPCQYTDQWLSWCPFGHECLITHPNSNRGVCCKFVSTVVTPLITNTTTSPPQLPAPVTVTNTLRLNARAAVTPSETSPITSIPVCLTRNRARTCTSFNIVGRVYWYYDERHSTCLAYRDCNQLVQKGKQDLNRYITLVDCVETCSTTRHPTTNQHINCTQHHCPLSHVCVGNNEQAKCCPRATQETYHRSFSPVCSGGRQAVQTVSDGVSNPLLGASCQDQFCPPHSKCYQPVGYVFAYCCPTPTPLSLEEQVPQRDLTRPLPYNWRNQQHPDAARLYRNQVPIAAYVSDATNKTKLVSLDERNVTETKNVQSLSEKVACPEMLPDNIQKIEGFNATTFLYTDVGKQIADKNCKIWCAKHERQKFGCCVMPQQRCFCNEDLCKVATL